jgi:hypothetical protein
MACTQYAYRQLPGNRNHDHNRQNSEVLQSIVYSYNIDMYKSINDFKKSYQPKANSVKDETISDLLADSCQYFEQVKKLF